MAHVHTQSVFYPQTLEETFKTVIGNTDTGAPGKTPSPDLLALK